MLDFQDYEDRSRRRRQEVKIGYVYTRVYRVPIGADADLIPARGDVVELRDAILPASNLLKPRVLNDPRRRKTQDPGSGQKVNEITMTFIQPVAYGS